MVSPSQMVREGSSEEGVLVGAAGEAKEAAQQCGAGEALGKGNAGTQPPGRNLLRPWGPRTGPRKEAAPTLAVPTERKVPGADVCAITRAIAHDWYQAHSKVSELGSLPGTPGPESQVSLTKEDFTVGKVQLEARLDPKTQTLSAGTLPPFRHLRGFSALCFLSLLLVTRRLQ